MARIRTDAPQPPSFEEQMRQAEQDAGIPADTEVYGEFMEAPEADEAGRVPTSREEPEAEVAEPTDAEDIAAAEADLTAGETISGEEVAEELESVAEEAVDPQAEINKKLGDLLNDNAELRRQNESLLSQLQQPSQPQPQIPLSDISWFDELAEAEPQQAAVWALQNQQTHLYDRAVRSWYDQDPVAAGRFERQLEQAVLQQNIQQSLQPQIQSAQEMAQRSELEQAMADSMAEHPDFAEVVNVTPAEVEAIFKPGPLRDSMEKALRDGTREEKKQVFDTIYAFKKSAAADVLVKAARETPVRQSEEAREAKREAFVGSASTTTPDEVPVTEEQRLAAVFADDSRSLRKNWKGR